MAVERVRPLACGRDAADVWEHAEQGVLDEHERSCPHCVTARADRARLGGLVARMAAEPLEPPSSVLEQVMGAVVADLRPHELLRIGPDAWLGRPAAESALRHVVDSMGGLRARRCRIEQSGATPTAAPGTAAPGTAVPGTTVPGTAVPGTADRDPAVRPVRVRMSVAARFGEDLTSVTTRVRQMIISAGERTLGLPIEVVDILVEDLWEEPA
ncbi:hypothetical protein SAMN05216207_102962 [Pseudonocardia ammonioxydans]|uniref:Asp23 family, cell envelope-related function n=1 Tax=Pseudonocardia ammonioxydans TaxID=260086 RepID=A0A1I5E6Y6_PSUAM|nr:hypothetical protein [Pseudonocardia ammonioxydans]SFO07368.1 hypothetical protein SAMN05216207_102962 [Pseudonocardia ammonioxydans]